MIIIFKWTLTDVAVSDLISKSSQRLKHHANASEELSEGTMLFLLPKIPDEVVPNLDANL